MSPEARERVAAAAELRYRPNMVAQHEVGHHRDAWSGRLGHPARVLLAGRPRDRGRGACRGFEVILANTDEDGTERAAVGVLLNKRVDGLIVAPAPGESAHLLDAEERGIPVVLLDRVGASARHVVVDNQRAARNAVRHLLGSAIAASRSSWRSDGAMAAEPGPAPARAG